MAYKDKDKQREANRERQRRYKANQKALPKQGVTNEKALLNQGVTEGVTDKLLEPAKAFEGANQFGPKGVTSTKRGKDIKCFADLPPDVQQNIISMSTINGKLDETKKAKRTTSAITYQHLFPDRYEPQAGLDAMVTGLPGDHDYNGVCLDAKYDSHRIPLKSSQDSSGGV